MSLRGDFRRGLADVADPVRATALMSGGSSGASCAPLARSAFTGMGVVRRVASHPDRGAIGTANIRGHRETTARLEGGLRPQVRAVVPSGAIIQRLPSVLH